MKKLLALSAILCCACSHVQAQNIEGQIVASQFGSYQVPGIATGSLQFEPATCQVVGGGKNFPAFATGIAVKIVDANPNLNEIGTPAAVFISQCAISMSTTYLHSIPFYVTSGTGGLQEALMYGPVKGGGPNTVILNADWYTQISPRSAATVIASVHGSTNLGIVDITTTPYTYYAWNGSQYVATGTGGAVGSVFGRTGTVTAQAGDYTVTQVTGAAPLASPALTGTPTAPTATNGTNTTQLATTAFVLANGGGPPTGTAGGALSGSYPTPGLAASALPNGMTATTQTTGENSTLVATDAFVYASIAPLAPLASPAFTGTPTAPTQAISTNNNDIATTAAVTTALAGTVSSQATGVLPLGTSATSIGAQSHLDDGNTITGQITSTEPFNVKNVGTFGASTYTSYMNSIISGGAGAAGNCALNGGAWYQSITAAVSGCVTAPAAGTGPRNVAGGIFAAYTQDNSGSYYSEPVGVIGVGTALANGGAVFGANLIAQDKVGCCTSGVVLVGQENDVEPASSSGPSAYKDLEAYRATLAFTNGNTGTYPARAFTINSNQAGAYWQTGLTTYTGAFGPSSVLFNINALGVSTSSSGNYNCPTLLNSYESYWTGTANAYEGWTMNCSPGSGTNPALDSFQIGHGIGTSPSGQVHNFDLTGGIQLELDGSTNGSAYLSASATGGTLNLGSTNATVTSAGALTVTSCSGCGGSGGSTWSAITNPSTSLALTMAANTSTFTFNAATGTSDLFKLTDTASNTGTGILFHATTASGSTEIPWQADANGIGWKVDASGQLASIGTGAGVMQLYNAAGTFYTQWSSGATANNTILGFAAAPVTGDLIDCVTTAASCQLTDTGVLASSLSGTITKTIANGTAAMPTTSIASGTCSAAVTVAAVGVVTTDNIPYTPAIDPTAVTGYAPSTSGSLYTWAYPTAGNVNFKVCNQTSASITPGALTMNWRVTR